MKFLTDQDVYGTTVRFLRDLGHEVTPAAKLGLAQADDAELLFVAHEQGHLFVTRDRDFGSLVFVHGRAAGVIYLRVQPSTQNSVHAELAGALTLYKEEELRSAFLVVEPGRHRIRRLPRNQRRPEPPSPPGR